MLYIIIRPVKPPRFDPGGQYLTLISHTGLDKAPCCPVRNSSLKVVLLSILLGDTHVGQMKQIEAYFLCISGTNFHLCHERCTFAQVNNTVTDGESLSDFKSRPAARKVYRLTSCQRRQPEKEKGRSGHMFIYGNTWLSVIAQH